jgi:glycosyltransferase involved in cell wall biosynthesis
MVYAEYLMDISVIVATYNRAEQLGEALVSLIRQETRGSFSFEIVVIDNASTDGTRALVEEMAQHSCVPLRYRFEAAKGVAHARNRGVRETSGEWLAFFDDDQIAVPCWLWELVAVAKKMDASCVGGCIRLRLPAQEEPNPLSPICRAILGETPQEKRPVKFSNGRFPGTGNALIDRTVFDAIGKFDESLSRGAEDTDFFRRASLAGFEIWYAPAAVIHHLIPAYRLNEDYFTWASLRQGANYAYMDYKEGGLSRLLLTSLARLGQAVLVSIPRTLGETLLRNKVGALGQKCLILRCVGYLRQSLFLISPSVFKQRSFFNRLEFRNEKICLGVMNKAK